MLPGSLVEPVENACRRQHILLARLYRMAENGAAIEEASHRRREVGPHRELACPGLVVEKARQRKGDVCHHRAERPWIEATAPQPVRERQHGSNHSGPTQRVRAVQIDVRVAHQAPALKASPWYSTGAPGSATTGSSQQGAGIVMEREIRRGGAGHRGVCARQRERNH